MVFGKMYFSCTMRLLFLGLAALPGCVRGEVDSFSKCSKFFYDDLPPAGLDNENNKNYAQICQRYNNTYHFASLYHRQWRTPLYSAYMFTPGGQKRPKVKWMYEPQLANSRGSPEMTPFPKHMVDQNVLESQAVLQDYTNSSYTKGHLNPNSHHKRTVTRKATFTLTNIVPQKVGSNSGPWSQLENNVSDDLSAYCTGPAYVVTGVLPYKSARWIRNRVAVPEYLWSAYCCPVFKSIRLDTLREVFPTFAAIGRNDPNSDEGIVPVNRTAKRSVRGYDVRRMSLATLEMYLEQRLGSRVTLFYNNCTSPLQSRSLI